VLQWSYLNVRSDAAFVAQEKQAEATLHGAFQTVESLKVGATILVAWGRCGGSKLASFLPQPPALVWCANLIHCEVACSRCNPSYIYRWVWNYA
jgi:hypothetical protein